MSKRTDRNAIKAASQVGRALTSQTQLLARVPALPITTWNCESQSASIRYIGPWRRISMLPSVEKHKLRGEIRNIVVATIALVSLGFSIFTFLDNRQARRDLQHPYIRIDDVTVDEDEIGVSAGGTTPKGDLFVQPGAIHATLRVYGNSPAIIRFYKMDCSSWPYTGNEDSRPNLTLLPGATKVFTCFPQITTPNQYARLEDPKQSRLIELTKPIDFKLSVVYEDIFHRSDTKDFCFSNRPDWDHIHLKSCEEPAAEPK